MRCVHEIWTRAVSGRRSRTPDVLVLCYHGVSETWPDPLAVSPEKLRRQVARLLAGGWLPATFTEAATAPSAPRTFAITFDDALLSVSRLALPVLGELGVPATVFTPTAYSSEARVSAWPGVDRWLGTDHEGELLGMGWPDLARLRDAGWEVGSHSVTHAALTDLDDPALQAELRDSKLAIERQLGACRSVAYPYGAVDDRVASTAKAIGYEAGAAVLPLRHGGDRMRVPRVPVLGGESELVRRLHLTRGMRRLQATRPWPAVQRAARAVRRSG